MMAFVVFVMQRRVDHEPVETRPKNPRRALLSRTTANCKLTEAHSAAMFIKYRDACYNGRNTGDPCMIVEKEVLKAVREKLEITATTFEEWQALCKCGRIVIAMMMMILPTPRCRVCIS